MINFVSIAILALFAAFLFYTGVIPSISDSYRTLKDKRVYHLFFAVVSGTVFLESIYSPDFLDIPYAIAGFCLWGLSLYAAFWKKDEKLGHVIFTYTAIAIGQTLTIIWIWPTWEWWALAPLVVLIAGVLLMKKIPKATYWREILVILTTFGPTVKL